MNDEQKELLLYKLRRQKIKLLEQRTQIAKLYHNEILGEYINKPDSNIDYMNMENDYNKLSLEIKRINRRVGLLKSQG